MDIIKRTITDYKLFEEKKDKSSDTNKLSSEIESKFSKILENPDNILDGLKDLEKNGIVLYRCLVKGITTKREQDKSKDLERLAKDIKEFIKNKKDQSEIEIFVDTPPDNKDKKRIFNIV